MAQKPKFNPLTDEDITTAKNWLSDQQGHMPSSVLLMLSDFLMMADELKNSESRRNNLLAQFRRALGIEPSSERKRGRSEKTLEDKKGRLIADKNKLKDRADWHKSQLDKLRVMEKDIDKKIKKIEEYEFTEEQLKEIKEKNDAESKKETAILNSGGEPNPALITPNEALMQGLHSQMYFEDFDACLTEEEFKNCIDTFTEIRKRYDIDVRVTGYDVHVEKGRTAFGSLISASTHEIGPPNLQVTWNFLAQVTLLITQYAMPFERLARLISTNQKQFGSNHISRYFYYVAKRLLPIYLHLGKSLANSALISGDDTTVRVTESAKALKEKTRPWEHYASQEKAELFLENNPDSKKLGPKIASELGFEFPKKNGTGGKIQLKTTVMIGKETEDPLSHIVFYRTHFGNFGNLLDVILQQRLNKNNKLFVQSDLLTANLISDKNILKNIEVTYFGCASHARRDFAHHEEDDFLCKIILANFRIIYFYEKQLDAYGRNTENVTGIRQESLRFWEDILEYCKKLVNSGKWRSSSSPLLEAANYVIKNYPKLTAYINHPQVPLSNDLSERMLRMEKIIQANSLFRTSLEGRFALDICRTIVQTAMAANVDVKEYLIDTLKQKDLETHPELYTPFAFSKKN